MHDSLTATPQALLLSASRRHLVSHAALQTTATTPFYRMLKKRCNSLKLKYARAIGSGLCWEIAFRHYNSSFPGTWNYQYYLIYDISHLNMSKQLIELNECTQRSPLCTQHVLLHQGQAEHLGFQEAQMSTVVVSQQRLKRQCFEWTEV